MKRSVKLDISWRAWSLIFGFFILIGFVGFSLATGGTNPAIMGHSYGELGIPTCANGEILKYNSSGGKWACGTDLNGTSLSCRIVAGTVGVNQQLCCNADEFVTGINGPEYQFTAGIVGKCVNFNAMNPTSAIAPQVVCCK